MPTEKEPAGFDKEEQVTAQSVERFYRFKESLRVVGSGPAAADLCESVGIDVANKAEIKNTALFRKRVLEQYLSSYFPRSSSPAEQGEKIGRHVERLKDFFRQENARSILWVGGSYGTGRAHSAQSDLDLFLGLPKLSSIAERNAEMQVFRNLETIDFVMAQSIVTLAMKTLKFHPSLVALILAGTKTTTWRLFDDKELKAGDVIDLVNKETGEVFARAVITDAHKKPIKDLDDADWEGHERFPSEAAMYEKYREYYPGREIGPATPVKIVRFKLL